MKELVLRSIEANYHKLSPNDKIIADFFITNDEKCNFSSKNISRKLFVSKSALSRFATKIGYKGYRDFILFYEKELENRLAYNLTSLTEDVLYSYEELIKKSFSLINEVQINNVVNLLSNAKNVYVYGFGNSGLTAKEFEMRFMRLGLKVYAITDVHIMNMNEVTLNESDLIIALSLSGYPLKPYITDAKKKGTKIVYLTTSLLDYIKEYSDEVLICPSMSNLDVGNIISPQMPLHLLLDIIYIFYLNNNQTYKADKLKDTLKYVEDRK